MKDLAFHFRLGYDSRQKGRLVKKETETSGVAEVFCERCGSERRHYFSTRTEFFKNREFLETTFTCQWCGSKSTVEGTTYKRAKLCQRAEVEFNFG